MAVHVSITRRPLPTSPNTRRSVSYMLKNTLISISAYNKARYSLPPLRPTDQLQCFDNMQSLPC
eukprot:scaffold15892_cov58-Cyclotella_meneghiniana.AAC.4